MRSEECRGSFASEYYIRRILRPKTFHFPFSTFNFKKCLHFYILYGILRVYEYELE